jgi:hypothetical protein
MQARHDIIRHQMVVTESVLMGMFDPEDKRRPTDGALADLGFEEGDEVYGVVLEAPNYVIDVRLPLL